MSRIRGEKSERRARRSKIYAQSLDGPGGGECDSHPGKPSYQELEAEIRRLKKELGYVAEINKVLKKSTAIFSSSEMGGLR